MSPKKKHHRGKTSSTLSLSERRLRAGELFAKGYTDTDVAKDLGVTRNTAAAYRKVWKTQIQERVQEDPGAFRDVLANTMRTLDQLQMVTANAWQALERKQGSLSVVCENCGEAQEFTYRFPPTDQARVQYLGLIARTTEQMAKLFGLMGVKQEVFIEIQNVNFVQNRMMGWLGENLDHRQREELATFIETELAAYVGAGSQAQARPVIDATAVESIMGESVPVPA